MFLLSFLPFTVIEALMRPFAMDVLLTCEKKDAGTASSLTNFVPTLLGSLGMLAGTLPWSDFVIGLGVILLVATADSIMIYRQVQIL